MAGWHGVLRVARSGRKSLFESRAYGDPLNLLHFFPKAFIRRTDKGVEAARPAGLPMRVNDPNLAGMTPDTVGGAGLERAQQTEAINRRTNGGAGGAAGSPDSVSLSGLSSQLRAMSADSPERVQRLDKLSEDVAANRYQVDAHKVSDRLIEDAVRPKI